MKRLGITLETVPRIHHVKEDPDLTTLKTKFNKLFNENNTKNGLEVKIQPKRENSAKLIHKKGIPIPIHSQSMEKKRETNKTRPYWNSNNIDENCFVSPALITVKKEKSMRNALDSRKLNEITVKRKAQKPNTEELVSQTSRKSRTVEQIKYACQNLIWTTHTESYCSRGKLETCAYLPKPRGILPVITVPWRDSTVWKDTYNLSGKDRPVTRNRHTVWLDDIIVVTKSSKEEHMEELIDVLTKLERLDIDWAKPNPSFLRQNWMDRP